MNDEQFREDMDMLIDGLLGNEEFVQGIHPLVEFLKQQKTCHTCKKTDATDKMLLVDGFPTCKRCRVILNMCGWDTE